MQHWMDAWQVCNMLVVNTISSSARERRRYILQSVVPVMHLLLHSHCSNKVSGFLTGRGASSHDGSDSCNADSAHRTSLC